MGGPVLATFALIVGEVVQKQCLELALLRDGNLVTLSGEGPQDGGSYVRVAHTPGETLRVIEQALERHTAGPLALAVKGAGSALLTWTTPSSTLALFWLSTILDQPFQPGFSAGPTAIPQADVAQLTQQVA
jgi:hypothetical protein